MTQSDDLKTLLTRLRDLFNSGSVVYESNGNPSGVAGLGDVGLASSALSMELAATTANMEEAMNAIIRHKQHSPEIFESVLYGALLNLVAFQLEPAFKLLDGTSTDRRVRAKREWKAVEEASGS